MRKETEHLFLLNDNHSPSTVTLFPPTHSSIEEHTPEGLSQADRVPTSAL